MIRKNILVVIVLFASLVFIITAYNSHGFYHADEHYQIIEFAGLKLGTHSPGDLAWEYKAQIRPALQPAMCFVLLRTLQVFNISDPYTEAFALRLLSALVSIAIITYFIRKTQKNYSEKDSLIYYLLSFFLWFIPVLSVRFSSETWSGLFFLLALGVFQRASGEKSKPYVLGLILGFSYLFRFQIAFAIFGFIIWLLLIHKSGLVYVLKMGLSFFAVILFGFLVDSWFYGEWVFTTWNYFYTFFQGEGADFGASPWYFYLEKLYDFPGYFLGILLMSAFIFILLFKPKNIYLWCLLPFILAHSLITHKEERFFFPMVFLFPILLMESWVILKKLIKVRLYVKILNVMLALIFLVVNGTGLIAMGQKSAGIGRMEITRYIHENYGNKSINLIYCSWANPYNPWHELPMKFYLEKSMSERRINNLGELNDSLIVHEKDVVNLLVLRKADLSYEKGIERIKNCDFSFEIQSIPKWIECINAKYKGFDNCDILELYRYTKKI